jgi:hypothetical protein
LPYIEATQSGPAAIAMCYGVPIIYNPIEALEFQLRDYNKKSTIKEFELNYDKILGNTLRKSSKFSISLFDQISILK